MPAFPPEVVAEVSPDDLANMGPPVVLIDFGFALQPSCLCHLPADSDDWDVLWDTIQQITDVDTDWMLEHWEDRNTYETRY